MSERFTRRWQIEPPVAPEHAMPELVLIDLPPPPPSPDVWHRDGVCPDPEGSCLPRMRVRCRRCGVERVVCTLTMAEVAAVKHGGWTDGCAEVTS